MILFALRHADRTTDGDQLSPAGVKRAELLARMLGESGVRIAFCSDAARTQQTVAPLKNALGAALQVVVVPTNGPQGIDGHIRDIVNRLDALPQDAVAVAVGHTNTIRPIIEGIGGKNPDPIAAETSSRKMSVVSRFTSGIVWCMSLHGEKTP